MRLSTRIIAVRPYSTLATSIGTPAAWHAAATPSRLPSVSLPSLRRSNRPAVSGGTIARASSMPRCTRLESVGPMKPVSSTPCCPADGIE